jgi:hypothetical protein
MNTQQYNYKINNQSGYPFLSITLEKNEIGLSVKSFTSSTLGIMSIIAYSPCFQNDVQLLLKDFRLIVQVGVDQAFYRPLKMHLLDKENQLMMRTGLMAIKLAEIKLDSNFIYKVNNYNLISRNAMQIDLSYRPNYFKNQNLTA